jgi:hypothetical protein
MGALLIEEPERIAQDDFKKIPSSGATSCMAGNYYVNLMTH